MARMRASLPLASAIGAVVAAAAWLAGVWLEGSASAACAPCIDRSDVTGIGALAAGTLGAAAAIVAGSTEWVRDYADRRRDFSEWLAGAERDGTITPEFAATLREMQREHERTPWSEVERRRKAGGGGYVSPPRNDLNYAGTDDPGPGEWDR